jgi:hypothetical protein
MIKTQREQKKIGKEKQKKKQEREREKILTG